MEVNLKIVCGSSKHAIKTSAPRETKLSKECPYTLVVQLFSLY